MSSENLSSEPSTIAAESVPPVINSSPRENNGLQQTLALLLSLCLGLFVADALLSFVDSTLAALVGSHILTPLRSLVALGAFLSGLGVYFLIGLTPSIPKRLFLIVALFSPLSLFALIPFVIYQTPWIELLGWGVTVLQVTFAIMLVYRTAGGLRWPLVTPGALSKPRFSWVYTGSFVAVNLFVLLPLLLVYIFFCTSAAIGRYSEGFITLRPSGLIVQARQYVDQRGKTVDLVPMSHIGDSKFYRQVTASFPTNSLILMEGVTDRFNLLTNRLTYKRAAKSLGLSEQQQEFKPTEVVHLVSADVDISDFSKDTVGFLNMVSLLYQKGLNYETLPILFRPTPPSFQEQLIDDILHKRNQHLVKELDEHLKEQEHVVIPWGAAHMPGIAHELEQRGFRVSKTRTMPAISFGSH